MAEHGSPNRLLTKARTYSDTSGHLTPESGHATGQRSLPQVPTHMKSFFIGLQQRQLDAIAFFLRTKEDSKTCSHVWIYRSTNPPTPTYTNTHTHTHTHMHAHTCIHMTYCPLFESFIVLVVQK